jgi:hypothetical protein
LPDDLRWPLPRAWMMRDLAAGFGLGPSPVRLIHSHRPCTLPTCSQPRPLTPQRRAAERVARPCALLQRYAHHYLRAGRALAFRDAGLRPHCSRNCKPLQAAHPAPAAPPIRPTQRVGGKCARRLCSLMRHALPMLSIRTETRHRTRAAPRPFGRPRPQRSWAWAHRDGPVADTCAESRVRTAWP